MKKIVALLGSPRKGSNSSLIAQKIMDAAAAQGAETAAYELYQLDFSGCIACMGCKRTSDECVLRDDLTQVLRAIREADVLLMATPVYFAGVTGPMKCAIDRMYSFMPPTYITGGPRTRLEPGKQCVFILTQGAPDPQAFAGVSKDYEDFFGPDWFGYETHVLRACGMSARGAAGEDDALMKQVDELTQMLLSK